MENLKCLLSNFPWDIFLACLLPLLLLWWFMNRMVGRYKSHASELQDRINFLEGELEACRKSKVSGAGAVATTAGTANAAEVTELKAKIAGLQADLDACNKAKLAAMAGGAAAGAAAGAGVSSFAAAAPAEPIKKDDLKVVEGIGPKIEELCFNAGIYTFAQLAETPSSRIKEILDAAGSRFQMHDPTTWPQQAALARDAKWDELKKWQDELNKGRS